MVTTEILLFLIYTKIINIKIITFRHRKPRQLLLLNGYHSMNRVGNLDLRLKSIIRMNFKRIVTYSHVKNQ